MLAYGAAPTKRPAAQADHRSCRRAEPAGVLDFYMEPTFQRLAVAVLLGMLVGLQREHHAGGIAGMRTFPLITLLGSVVGHPGRSFRRKLDTRRGAAGSGRGRRWSAIGSGRSPTATAGHDDRRGHAADVRRRRLTMIGPLPVAIAVGGGVAVLLQFKPELHSIAQRLGDEDLRAIMQFVLITCIILPVLPNRNYRPARQPAPLRAAAADLAGRSTCSTRSGPG